MTDPTPLISNELGGIIATAVIAAGGAIAKGIHWAVSTWMAMRAKETDALLADRKEDRDERRQDRGVQVELQLSVAALVERDRIRDERRKRESMPATSRVPRREFDAEEVTDVSIIKERLREAAMAPRKTATPALGIKRPNTRAEDR